MATNNLSLLRKGHPFIMRGAYALTLFVGMYAPLALLAGTRGADMPRKARLMRHPAAYTSLL